MKTVHLPMQTRLAPVASVMPETRTATVVWTTGARVRRVPWDGEPYMEELSLAPGAVRLERLRAGAPLLDSHARWSVSSILGVVEDADIVDGAGRARVRFSERESVEPIFRDVVAGVIRNVSVGYIVHKYEQTREQDGTLVMRAVDWEPMEISLVPVGADAGAGVRADSPTYTCAIEDAATAARKETHMSEQNTLAVEAAAGTDTTNDRLSEAPRDAAERAVREERARVREIQSIVRAASLDVALADEMIAAGTSLDGARKRVLDELAKRGERAPISAVHSGIETVVDETVTRRAAIRDALLHRAMPGHFAITEAARPWAGYSMREIMRRCLEMRGVRTDGMSVTQMWERTFTSASDLPYILLDAANKSLRAGYESAPRTFTVWCRRATAPDFRQIHRVQLSGAPSLLEVKAGGEYRRGTVSDAKETYQLLTYGRVIGFNRQVIVNDDMDAIGRLPMLAARAAADLESDVVYSVLTANAALSDGIALFHSSHGNLAGTGSAISVTSLGAGRAAMRKQKGLEGRPINARPAFLIVPAAVEMVAEQYTSADFVSAKSSDINPFRQGRPSALTVVTEPRLDDSSATAWYLSADPAQIDTVEYAYLEGEEGVYLETRMGFDVDGIEMKVRLDFAAKAIDFRGLYKNPGA